MSKKKVIQLGILGLFSVFSLTSCDTSKLEGNISEVINQMLPNLWITIMQVALFIITFLVVFFLAYKPVKKKLKQRSEHIENNIRESEEKKKEADENLKVSQEVVNASELQAGEIIKNAQTTAEVKMASIQQEIDRSIEKQKLQAHKDIENERKKMLREVNDTIVSTAIDASKEVLKREVNEKDNQKYVENFISQLIEEDEIEKSNSSNNSEEAVKEEKPASKRKKVVKD